MERGNTETDVENMKKILALLLLACLTATAQDINPGISFTAGQKLTAAQLSQLVSAATILPAFYTRQTDSSTNLAIGDVFLVVRGGNSFAKLTGEDILKNPQLVTQQTLKTNADTNAVFMFYDGTGAELAKISMTNLGATLSSYITASNINVAILPVLGYLPDPLEPTNIAQLMIWDTNNAPSSISLSNLQASIAADILTNQIIPKVNQQMFQPWSLYSTNWTTNVWEATNIFAITNISHVNGTNTNDTIALADTIPMFSTLQNSNTTVTMQALYQYFTNLNTFQSGFVSHEYSVTFATNYLVANTNHNLGSTPSRVNWVLVCKTSDVGYDVGDEISIYAIDRDNGASFAGGANSTNVFLIRYNAGLRTFNKESGAISDMTESRWKAKCYAAP